MQYRSKSQFDGLFDSISNAVFGGAPKKIGQASQAITRTANDADKAIKDANAAVNQGREVISTVSRTANDMQAYLQRISGIPVEELARRFDYKSKVATEELISLSSFMKKSLIYLCGMATLSIYLNILTRT